MTFYLALSLLEQMCVFMCVVVCVAEPTTEVLRPDQRGPCTEPHLLVMTLQADMRSCTSSGSVATFTSDSALAQADELTSHMKENTTVTTKSWMGWTQHRHTGWSEC